MKLKIKSVDGNIRVLWFDDPKFRSTPTLLLNLSTRAKNVLNGNNLITMGDVVDNWNRLPRIKNVGVTVLREIYSKVIQYQFSILDEDEQVLYLQALQILNGDMIEFVVGEESEVAA